MNTAAMVITWINENGVGTLDRYDIEKAATMLQQWADEDTNGILTALDPEDVAAVIETHRFR